MSTPLVLGYAVTEGEKCIYVLRILVDILASLGNQIKLLIFIFIFVQFEWKTSNLVVNGCRIEFAIFNYWFSISEL